MGYMRRHAIVVTSYNGDAIKQAHAKAREIFGRDAALPNMPADEPGWEGKHGTEMVSSIVSGVMNADTSFFIGPDGSKEGWEHSHEGDRRRAEFVAWLRAETEKPDGVYCYWAELFYGDDDGGCTIVSHG